MNTSLIQFLREAIRSSRKRPAIGIVVGWLIPVVAAIALLATSGISVLLGSSGFVAAAAVVILLVVARLIVLDAGLEMRRGLTIAQVIASSGFALLRSKREEELLASRLETMGRRDGKMEMESPEIRLHRELEVKKRGLRREQESQRLEDQRHLSWVRLKAALRSSGFSVIREGLPDKDRTGIG